MNNCIILASVQQIEKKKMLIPLYLISSATRNFGADFSLEV